jgi:hypothetical protein
MSGIAASVISGWGVWGFRKAFGFYNNDFSLGSFLSKLAVPQMPRPADLCAVRGCRAARADRALRGSARSASPKLEPSPLGEWSTVESRRAGAQKKKAKGGSNARQIIAPQSLAKLRGWLTPAVAVAAPDPATVDEHVPTNVLRGALRRFAPLKPAPPHRALGRFAQPLSARTCA